jgi:hypothetical protein
MKRTFVRALWGNIFTPDNLASRGTKVKMDISNHLNQSSTFPMVVYTFGELNHKNLLDMGVHSRLISKEASIWNMETELYRHKLEVFKYAMDDFDEIVYLDWDCVPTKKIPIDFWDMLNKKESFQANLFQYLTKKCLWREDDQRKVTNGGFVYIREKQITNLFIQYWNDFKEWTTKQKESRSKKGKDLRFREKCLIFDDEPSMSKYVDEYLGKWQGEQIYWNLFEPEVCNLRKKSVYSKDLNDSKDACFMHML